MRCLRSKLRTGSVVSNASASHRKARSRSSFMGTGQEARQDAPPHGPGEHRDGQPGTADELNTWNASPGPTPSDDVLIEGGH